MRMRYMVIAALTFLSTAACSITETDETESPPYLGDSGIRITFSVPDTVTQGVPFDVSFRYYGSSSCTQGIRIDRQVEGNVATLRSRVSGVNGVCTADLHAFTATELVQFSTRGLAEVRLPGLFDFRDTVVVRTVVVR